MEQVRIVGVLLKFAFNRKPPWNIHRMVTEEYYDRVGLFLLSRRTVYSTVVVVNQ